MNYRPLSTSDGKIIKREDGQIISLPDWTDFPDKVYGSAPNSNNGWYGGSTIEMPKLVISHFPSPATVYPYQYSGYNTQLTWNYELAFLASFHIKLVHFVDSGHIGWYMTLAFGEAWGQAGQAMTAKLCRAYDINAGDGLSPYGWYGVMETNISPAPDWFKGQFEIKDSP